MHHVGRREVFRRLVDFEMDSLLKYRVKPQPVFSIGLLLFFLHPLLHALQIQFPSLPINLPFTRFKVFFHAFEN
jgi:hypothetical protein